MAEKNLIRNGGFEEGSMQHWTHTGAVTTAVVTTSPYSGVYCLEATSTAAGPYALMHTDYIKASYGDVFILGRGMREVAAYNQEAELFLYQFDAEQHYIGYTVSPKKLVGTSWEYHETALTVMEGASYVLLGAGGMSSSGGQRYRYDAISMVKLDMSRNVKSMRELCSLTDVTSSGEQVNIRKTLTGFTRYYAEMMVSHAAGTNPTLKVYVKEKDSNGGDRVLGEFSSMTAADDQRVGISPPLGEIYVAYTIGGTSPHFSFGVNVIGTR